MPMPRYQSSGIAIASMPTVSTAGYQATAQANQALSAAMDRVTNFALRQMEVQAQIEGEEYGALNAPTQQQLADALAAGEDVTQMVPGDKTTVFGRAARNAALTAITSSMELNAANEITNLQGQFESGQIGMAELQGSLESLVKSQTEVVSTISPVAARKFAASVGTTANSAYLAAMKKNAKDQAQDMEIQYRSGVDNYIRNAETIVRAGNTVANDGTVVTVDQKIDVIRKQIEAAAQVINDPEFYQVKIKELDDAVSAAKVGVVMDEAMLKPAAAYNILRGKGKFQDAEVQATFESMSNEERRTLYGQVQTALSAEFSLNAADDAAVERRRTTMSNDLQGEITRLMLSGDRTGALNKLEELRSVDPAAYASKAETLSTKPGIDRPDVITSLRRMSLNNNLTQGAVDKAFQAGDMSLSTYKEFMTDLESQRNQAYNEAVEWLRLDRGLPSGTLINFSAVQRAADKEVAGIKKDLILALQKDPALDPMTFVQDKVAELVKNGGSAADAKARQQAESVLDEIRIGAKNPSLTAQQAITLLNSNPNIYPNQQKRDNAINNLLPVLISIEGK